MALGIATATSAVTCTDTLGPGPSGELAFWRVEADGQFAIYTVTLGVSRATTPVRVSSVQYNDLGPEWSPDGSRIAFNSSRQNGPEIYVMNPDGSGVHEVTDASGLDYCPSWSPDGRQLVYAGQNGRDVGIYLVNVDGTNAHLLVNTLPQVPICPGVAWSPDGTRVLFVGSSIYVVNADGSGLAQLPDDSAGDRDPSWSPDGKRIAFYSSRNGVGGIYVMSSDGTNVQSMITSPGVNECPSWSPEGGRLAFTSSRDGQPDVYVADVRGRNVLRVTNDSLFKHCPRWRR